MSLLELLGRTSRTFALAIPLLPEGLSAEVGIAYLLFRVADTLEDAEWWGPARRAEALDELVALLSRVPRPYDWLTDPPTSNADYLELLARLPEVLAALSLMGPKKRELVIEHAIRTAHGMRTWVLREHKARTLEDLRGYCYVVAGIVGELLTELFVDHDARLSARRDELMELAPAFGEALQLVNVLKDRDGDAREGRRLLPPGVPLAEVFELARRDLEKADRYAALVGPPLHVFCQLPTRLARASLDRIEREGPGAKLTRDEVASILASL